MTNQSSTPDASRIKPVIPGTDKLYAGTTLRLDFCVFGVNKAGSFTLPKPMSLSEVESYVTDLILSATSAGIFGLEETELRDMQAMIIQSKAVEA